ncbi:unnamed protein product [Didymodactylos carnosus]|uniref:Uncharacterized protein n=1 Tax=Didymodactylos carnosus TaxID=1234261 RepID=A0A813VU87_9BILA|nr:unnamed protein product [Didymodactylos carnosus]CAF3629616.1 unnamed protein product [Didymodactylos carnosus]
MPQNKRNALATLFLVAWKLGAGILIVLGGIQLHAINHYTLELCSVQSATVINSRSTFKLPFIAVWIVTVIAVQNNSYNPNSINRTIIFYDNTAANSDTYSWQRVNTYQVNHTYPCYIYLPILANYTTQIQWKRRSRSKAIGFIVGGIFLLIFGLCISCCCYCYMSSCNGDDSDQRGDSSNNQHTRLSETPMTVRSTRPTERVVEPPPPPPFSSEMPPPRYSQVVSLRTVTLTLR